MIKRLSQASACLLLLISSLIAFAEDTTFTTSHFSGSGNCSMCHDGLTDTAGDDVSIVRDWGSSMMANATKDPFWRAKVATELERNPQLSAVINDTCSKCHAPVANYEITRVQGGAISLFGPDGVLNPGHALHDAGMNGVSCTVCHQITDDASLGTLDGFSGQYNINNTKTIYGQYSDIFGQPMINNTGYMPAYSAHVSDSATCATCHNLKTPFVDSNGVVVTDSLESGFPEQMPYTEWQNSIFDDAGSNPQSCQDCHMPKTTSKVSNRPRWLGTKDGFSKHHLVGANTIMLTMLRDNAALLDVTSPGLDLGISRARDMLRSAANIEIVSASVINGILEARVRVENTSGHKVPTAYPSRRMWIHFRVSDSNNNVVFESGRFNADGSIEGADNDADQTVFEPHYPVISSASQVQIYETVMGDTDGSITYTLLRGAQYIKDNRLTPKGFSKFNVPDDVAVHGQAFDDTDFDLGSDIVTYRIPVSAAGDLDITASLNYQTIAHGFLQDLYQEAHLEQVQTFKSLYDAQGLKHEQIASVQTTVASDGGGVPPVPVVDLSAAPLSIDQGQIVTLNWTASDADSCVASGVWSGDRGTIGSETVSPAITSTYILTCTGDGGSASNSVTVMVNVPPAPLPVVSLSVSTTVIDPGQTAVLTWTSSDATGCIASGDWSGNRSTSGTETVSPGVSSTYTLACTGDGGSASDSVSLVVNEPPPVTAPTLDLTASPASVRRGGTIILSWSSTDAGSCVASVDWSGSMPTAGTLTAVINSPGTFTLTCSGDGGSVSDSVSYRGRGRRWLDLR